MLLQIIFLSLAFAFSTSALKVEGPCRYNEITVMKNLDLNAYSGLWYEIERYDLPLRQNSDCIKFDIKSENGNEIYSTETGFNYFNGQNYEIKGQGMKEDGVDAKLRFWYENQQEPQDTNYWVLDTDYKNFAIVWGCKNLEDGNSEEYYTLMSREKKITSNRDVRKRVMEVIDQAEVDVRYIRITVQEDDVC
ncbi:lopap-like [Culicoides brevitarsis]|uniref:lopap-like n=1 Tax=Culicoides brevitarsis TaxID=469753 RepID=UPI00307BB5A0